jgi:Ca-activated chloride channel family protein
MLLLLALAGGAAPAEEQRVVPRFRSGVDLVKVTATVRDAEGRLVGDQTRDDFEVFEDGRPQRITQFDRGRVPVSLGVVLDVSQSMLGQRMDDARAALQRFLVDLLEPGDEVFLMVFNHDPKLEAPWTLGPSRLRGRLDRVRPYGATAIYDALMMALPLFTVRAHDRAAVVLISDGSDTASDVTREDVRWQIRLSDAFVYAVGIDAPERRPINDRVNARLLRDITAESGGYAEVISDSPELAPATERIAEELRHQYSLGYTPSASPDGRYRRIRVRVRGGDYDVRARRGYVASARP